MSSASTGVGDVPAGVFLDGRFEPPASDWLRVLGGPGAGGAFYQHPGLDLILGFTRDLLRGYAFAAEVNGNEVHVDDGCARHGGEGQLAAFMAVDRHTDHGRVPPDLGTGRMIHRPRTVRAGWQVRHR